MPFPKSISQKVNVIAHLEYELASNDVAVYNISYDTAGTSPTVLRFNAIK